MGIVRSESLHRRIRHVAKWYPFLNGPVVFSRMIGLLMDDKPLWIESGRWGAYPSLTLNVSQLAQRKVFYFPKPYGDLYLRKPLARFLRERLKPGATFIDVGANLGMFTLLAAEAVGPAGRVYAFEPEPNAFESLSRTVAAHRLANVTPLDLALSDRVAELQFFRARDGWASSLLPEAPGRQRRYEGELMVKVTTLDELVRTGAVVPGGLGFIKIDVEGEEPRVVAGMLETVRRTGWPPIWCEVRGPQGSRRAPGTFAAVHAHLAPLGYRASRWDGRSTPVTVDDVRGREDILFERPAQTASPPRR